MTKDPTKRMDIYTIKTHRWLLLSDSAIELKVDLADQAIKRDQKRVEEEKERALIPQFNFMNLDEEIKQGSIHYKDNDLNKLSGTPNRKKVTEDRRKSTLNVQGMKNNLPKQPINKR